jgi:hypothetical protein
MLQFATNVGMMPLMMMTIEKKFTLHIKQVESENTLKCKATAAAN